MKGYAVVQLRVQKTRCKRRRTVKEALHWFQAEHSVVDTVVVVESFGGDIACPNCHWSITFHLVVKVVLPYVYLFVRIRGYLRKVVILIGGHGVQNEA
jgi:hypothetical protein